MPQLPHLILPRAEVEFERRKRRGFGKQVPRNPAQQSERVDKAVDEALATHARLRATTVDPKLIVRVKTSHPLSEDEWMRAGLIVLGHDENNSVVLFSGDAELTEFRARLQAYGQGVPQGQKSPSYSSLISAIEELDPLTAADRIGSALKYEGFETLESFEESR